jgi:hypothetical protein
MLGRDRIDRHGPDGLAVGGEGHTPLIPMLGIAPAGLEGCHHLVSHPPECRNYLLNTADCQRVASFSQMSPCLGGQFPGPCQAYGTGTTKAHLPELAGTCLARLLPAEEKHPPPPRSI